MARRRKKKKKRRAGVQTNTQLDAEGLRRIARRRPEEAARTLARARRGDNVLSAPADELDGLCVHVAGELRKARLFDDALSLLSTLDRTSVAAALEEALIAFARGEDGQVREIAERTPTLAKTLSPLLTAARGEPAGRAPRGSDAALKALYGAARAVGASAKGDHAAAARTAAAIGEPSVRSVMRAAVRLVSGDAERTDLERLEAIEEPSLRRLAWIGYAEVEPQDAFLRATDRETQHHALSALARRTSSRSVLDAGVHELGPEVFERPGDAMLAVGFHRLRETLTEPETDNELGRDFARALELDAELEECLRGSWLAARMRATVTTGDEDHRRLVSVAAPYARLLAKDPRHGALHAAVLLDLAWLRCGFGDDDLDAALSEVAVVRAALAESWFDTRALRSRADRTEARVHLARGDTAAARPLSRRLLEQDGRHPASWTLALKLATPEEVPDLAARAYAATNDDCFRRWTPGGSTSAGALARELADAPESGVAEALERCADRSAELSDDARRDFDIGATHVLVARGEATAAERHLEARLHDRAAPVEDLLLTALMLELTRPVRAYLDGLACRPDDRQLAALCELVLDANLLVSPAFAGVMLGRLARWLSSGALKRLRRRLRSHDVDAAYERADRIYDRTHDALHPEICISALDLDAPEELLASEAVLDSVLLEVVSILGLPASALAEIPYERKREFVEKEMGDMTMGPAEIGVAIAKLLGYEPALEPRSRKPKRDKPKKKRVKPKKRRRR